MAIKEIEVQVKEVEIKNGPNKGRTFNAFKAVTKDGTLIDLKFRKEVKDVPEEHSIIKVDSTKMNIQKNKKYPIVWVQEIEECIPYSAMQNDEHDQEVLDEMFK